MSYPNVYLLRHGQTEWNIAGRLQGRLDSPLTATGIAQAERQGALLSDVWAKLGPASLLSSPQGRARHTAEIAFAGIDAPLFTDSRLCEISAGAWDGAFLADIEQRNAPLFEQARNAFELMLLAPDGEGEGALLARCRAFLADLTEPCVLVTHGVTLCVLRGVLREMRFEDMLELSHEQGCIYAIENGKETILR